ncbi:GGDEF domain-containing protein [Mycolicibacterium diernhoferi]|uniref:GGDEF domain-containing protein n=1 Tax=Mycolicibacterium diernhoferi TaxID=1801 RepID=A0A1Q4H6E8_9MYCO|nr:GGDEF domain-containing protein [Mycolicibacterium diernhoferi]OJZ63033.1 GGDEF domain-containing protein [Mycolicibacterium diernhoferi]OPE45473.1 GGDEF domain-containing protein [Mycolicibacterium diernhoferi]PEG53145.1 GGDEF domain-containing protein [Mycolicibacterium diernhoferi]QYL22081.1 GGDEF domain-containing protein [Mycolicibacterium diernhoferi]
MPGFTTVADGRFLGRQHIRLLRIYLAATTFLYTYGVVFTLFPVRTDLEYGNPVGGMIAIALGVAALIALAVRPGRAGFATGAAVLATPIVLAYHVTLTAQYVCLIAPMFLAMYLRAFHPPRRAWVLITLLTAACVAAVAVSPAPHVTVITYLIVIVAIFGAAESFGFLMRAMFTAACTDPLTGVSNRAGWEIDTAELVARFRSAPVPVTVIALDIDGLKNLNDTYGHQAGDRRIAEYARAWARATPRDAVVARLGGDEFGICVVHPQAVVVQRLLDEIRTQTPGVSIGTATGSSVTADIAALYAEADAELYRSRGIPLRDELGPR